jgi:hypothetical protein
MPCPLAICRQKYKLSNLLLSHSIDVFTMETGALSWLISEIKAVYNSRQLYYNRMHMEFYSIQVLSGTVNDGILLLWRMYLG